MSLAAPVRDRILELGIDADLPGEDGHVRDYVVDQVLYGKSARTSPDRPARSDADRDMLLTTLARRLNKRLPAAEQIPLTTTAD